MPSELKGRRRERNAPPALPFAFPAWLLAAATLLSTCAAVTARHQPDGRASGTAPAIPFGRHGRPYHAVGIIRPNHVDPAQLDATTAAYYDAWKARYVEPACDPGDYRVKSIPATKAHTVSEAHGYGMMAAVLMAGHDPNAHALFDGFHRYYRRHPTLANNKLMAWAQGADCRNVGGSNSATDGDLDIAYALLLADKQWGSGGEIDYRDAALDIIAAILKAEVTPAGTLLVGDWVSDPRGRRYRSTRGSDFIPEHFRAFARAVDDQRWQAVLEKTYFLTRTLQSKFAPTTGLLPDFIEEATGESPRPAPPMFLEKVSDGQYSWNACRVPWRISTDYLMAGEPRAQAAMQTLNAWLRVKTGDDPRKIVNGYALDGGDVAGPGEDGTAPPSLAFVAPFMVSAMIQPQTGTNQPWLNALWDEVAGRPINEYYGDSIKLFAMILASGNWWTP